jgi:uncharacterized protein (AIM24 family)
VALDLAPGQKYIVDTGHMIAMQPTVQYDIRRIGSWKSTILSGEGFVVDLTGPGKVILQTRSPRELGSWIYRHMPHPAKG